MGLTNSSFNRFEKFPLLRSKVEGCPCFTLYQVVLGLHCIELHWITFMFINIATIATSVQSHSLLSGHYDCNVLRFSTVRYVKNFTASLVLSFSLSFVCQVMFSDHSDQMSQR